MKKPKYRAFLALAACMTVLAACAQRNPVNTENPMFTAEHRATWVIHRDLTVEQEQLLQHLKAYREANINTLCVLTQNRGYVLYPGSENLPQLPEMEGRDIFPWLIKKAHEMNMAVEAWPEFGFYAYHTSDASADSSRGRWLDEHPGLASVDDTGSPVIHHDEWGDFFSLDPANPEAQDLLLDLFVEMVTRYDFDGINLDRIRFARPAHGYSEYDRTNFAQDTGYSADDIEEGNEAWKAWIEWRKTQLTEFMKRASERLRAARPGLRITMATVPPESIDPLGQDWPTWLERGYLDAAYPMLYGENPGPRYEEVRRLTDDNPRVYAGLDLTAGFGSFELAVIQWRLAGGRGVAVWHSEALRQNAEKVQSELFQDWMPSPLHERLTTP